ncbi:integral membrane protein GPR180-like [Littorina saxatilis]|uniref:integral membrane protein GPR180-like n=1 Tax=Littorina saxatilis TaxID=31220 RepID=UPI0038B62CEA
MQPLTSALLVVVVLNALVFSDCRTIRGIVSSLLARREKGQYLSSFAFHGEAVVNVTLNATSQARGRLLLYHREDWRDASEDSDCVRRLGKARILFLLNKEQGQVKVPHSTHPRIWHIIYADEFTCLEGEQGVMTGLQGMMPDFVQYHLDLLNPDALGNPLEHFGDEETGMLKFYQLLTVAYFVVACAFAPRLHQTLSKGGPMQLVIQLLTVSVFLQAVGAFLMVIHLSRYSRDGIGSPALELISELSNVLSQFTMLLMLLSLSLGWTLASAHSVCRYSHFRSLAQRPAAHLVGALGVLQGLLFLWEQYEGQDSRQFYAHRSMLGVALVLLRISLAGLLAWNLHCVIRAERSALKREFYTNFMKCCMLWFLCYPVFVLFTRLVSEYLRYKLITMGVLICQSIAGVFLYRLFLSRSLYWEVSALSSNLPLRLDRSFSLKMYS